jgi:glyoxylase-like metal-dependent hydrolase (beta-lactamase superfamily II)
MSFTFSLRRLSKPLLALTTALGLIGMSIAASHAAEAPLQLEIYNPGTQALFPVSSVLVTGQHEAILVDAQFGRAQAQQVVEKIRASGKRLSTIYISHGDPDYYFGLDTITAAYPGAKVVATAPTVAHIQQTMAAKQAFWGPKLGADAPQKIIVPQVLQGDTLTLEGQQLKVFGLDGPQPERSVVWIPSLQAVVGGVVVDGLLHVWMADTQGAQSHQDWLSMLARIEQLQPRIVVPGHFAAGAPMTIASVHYTRDYIQAFDSETRKASDANALIAAMKARYPQPDNVSSLELSAKVAKGEMKW